MDQPADLLTAVENYYVVARCTLADLRDGRIDAQAAMKLVEMRQHSIDLRRTDVALSERSRLC